MGGTARSLNNLPGSANCKQLFEQHSSWLLRLGQPAFEQIEQFLLQAAHLVEAVAGRIGVVVEYWHTVGADLDFQRQILHRPGAQVQRSRRAVAVSQWTVERHDVDQRAKQALLSTNTTEVPTQRFVAVMLMFAAAPT